MSSARRPNEYFSYSYSEELTRQINGIRDRVMGPMPDRSKWMNDEVHTTSVFVGSDRYVSDDERQELREELRLPTASPIKFKVVGAIKGEKPVILLELDYADETSEALYLSCYRGIFNFLNRKGFPQNMSFASLDKPPTRHITLSWVPADQVDDYLGRFQADEGVKDLQGTIIQTRSFRLVRNDGYVSETYNNFE